MKIFVVCEIEEVFEKYFVSECNKRMIIDSISFAAVTQNLPDWLLIFLKTNKVITNMSTIFT